MKNTLAHSLSKKFKHALQGDDPKDYVLIETGSWMGYGIEAAQEVGFSQIYSIELSEKYWNICKNKFSNDDSVTCIFGDSSKMLPTLIEDIDKKILFYLDAHYDGGDTATSGGGTGFGLGCVLYNELQAIKQHKRKDHIILIDDFRNIVNGVMGIDPAKLSDLVKDINEDYESYVLPKALTEDLICPDVLVCRCDLQKELIGAVIKE